MLFVNYCHQCMAFSIDLNGFTQQGEDTGKIWYDSQWHYGPFDSWDDVNVSAAEFLSEAFWASAAPWSDDAGPWLAIDPDHPSLGER